LEQLRKAGIQVVVVNESKNFNQVYDSIQLIAKVTGTTDKAEQIVHRMKATMAAVHDKTAKIPESRQKTVWVEVSPAPDIYTTGSGTFMDQMLDLINADNIAADKKGWVKYSPEAVVNKNPDVIVITYGNYVKNPVKQVLTRSGWQNVKAVKNHKVFSLNADIVTRPGPRLAKGVEQLAHAVYPDVFK
jgi:iron complex transport system substrate-binding protein